MSPIDDHAGTDRPICQPIDEDKCAGRTVLPVRIEGDRPADRHRAASGLRSSPGAGTGSRCRVFTSRR